MSSVARSLRYAAASWMSGTRRARSSDSGWGHDAEVQQRLEEEQVRLLFRRGPVADVSGIVFSLLLFSVVSAHGASVTALVWLALKTTSALSRISLSVAWHHYGQPHSKSWLKAFLTLLFIDGMVWGLSGVLLMRGVDTGLAAYLLISMLGVATVGSLVVAMHWRAMTLFSIPVILPCALWILTRGHEGGTAIGIGLLMFAALLLKESRGIHHFILEMLRLQLVNARIARERRTAQALAEHRSRYKSQFLATMSHEMRTPLHGIIGLAQQLSTDMRAAPLRRELRTIECSGSHLLDLINDALDYSQLEIGKMTLRRAPFDLGAVVDTVLSVAAPLAKEKGLSLHAHLAVPRPCWIEGDEARVRQILYNLVGNAVKFTEDGGVRVDVHAEPDGRLRMEVIDTGIGISDRDLAVIFEAFQQADGSFSRRFGGVGLGLSISRELAQAMGGDIKVTTCVGQGSVFSFTAAFTPAQPPAPTPAPRPDGEVASCAPVLRGRVLLAEDHVVNAMLARTALERLGLTVDTVSDGASAVEAYLTAPPDIVLMDCQMPVLDGLSAARQIRTVEREKGWAHVPIVALTANALEEDRHGCLQAGMDDHLTKPFRMAALQEILQRHLEPMAHAMPEHAPLAQRAQASGTGA